MISSTKSVSVKNTISNIRCKFIMYNMDSFQTQDANLSCSICTKLSVSICCYLLSPKTDQYSIISSSKSVLVKTDFHLKISFRQNWFPPQNQFQWKLMVTMWSGGPATFLRVGQNSSQSVWRMRTNAWKGIK